MAVSEPVPVTGLTPAGNVRLLLAVSNFTVLTPVVAGAL